MRVIVGFSERGEGCEFLIEEFGVGWDIILNSSGEMTF
jgi:hypothetical protein